MLPHHQATQFTFRSKDNQIFVTTYPKFVFFPSEGQKAPVSSSSEAYTRCRLFYLEQNSGEWIARSSHVLSVRIPLCLDSSIFTVSPFHCGTNAAKWSVFVRHRLVEIS